MKKLKILVLESSKMIGCAGLHACDMEHMSRPPRNLILVLGYKSYPKTRFYQHRNRPRFRRIRPRFRESDVGFDRNRGRIREFDSRNRGRIRAGRCKTDHRKTKRCELLMDRISVSQWY